MNNTRKFKIFNPESGVSLIITFFIMVMILSVVLSISVLLYSEVKIIRNIGSSTTSLYAAESGIEKVLYYDRQVIPSGAARGLCSMYLYNPVNNPKACRDSGDARNFDLSVYCDHSTIPPVSGSADGCKPDVCNNCTVIFDTSFDSRKYTVTATVAPDVDTTKTNPDYNITSKGVFGGAERQIQILINPKE